MAKYKPDMWRTDSYDFKGEPVSNPEPWDYQMSPDPLHGGSFEAGREDMLRFIKETKQCFICWINDHSRNLDGMLKQLKSRWLKAGGGNDQWETIFKVAMTQSGYAKKMSKEVKELSKEVPKVKVIEKPKPFNGLDFSGMVIK